MKEMDPTCFHGLNAVYLDVSEFILKEHSPQYKPIVMDNIQVHPNTPKLTPDIAPIDLDPSAMTMSPFFGSIKKNQATSINEMFLSQEEFQLEEPKNHQNKWRKSRKQRPRSNTFELLNPLETQLDKIIEENNKEDSNDYQESSQEDSEEQVMNEQDSVSISYECNRKISDNPKDMQQQKQSTNFSLSSDHQSPHLADFYTQNYKNQLINKLKEIAQSSNNQFPYDQKINKIKQSLSKYLFDYEIFAIESMWHQMEGSANSIIFQIVRTIQSLFEQKIGMLTFENRRLKLLRYLEKKKRRIWKKKVSYDCRKKVADGRLRIKGKFVTKEQVCCQLGLEKFEYLSPLQLKALIQHKMEDRDSDKDGISKD